MDINRVLRRKIIVLDGAMGTALIEKGYKEEKIDFDTARFYISPDKKKEASTIVDKDTSSPIKPVLATLLAVALFACISIVLPDLLAYISNSLA